MKIIYPYIEAKWGEELKYSLRSLEKNFQGDFEVWIMGDKPDWIQGVVHIAHTNKSFLQINKCRLFDLSQQLPEPEDFVWMNDDIYLLKSITIDDLSKYYYLSDVANVVQRGKTAWHKTLFATTDFCKEMGYTQFNFECHIPMVFNVSKLIATFERFSELKKWCTITAYRNMHIDRGKLVRLDHLKSGFYEKSSEQLKIYNQSLFLNHDDKGLTSQLKKYIASSFPTPSRFEK